MAASSLLNANNLGAKIVPSTCMVDRKNRSAWIPGPRIAHVEPHPHLATSAEKWTPSAHPVAADRHALAHRLSARRGGWPIPNSQGEPKPRVRALITRRDEEYTARRDSNRKLAGDTPEPKRVSGGLFVARAKGQSESLIKTSNRSIRASTI